MLFPVQWFPWRLDGTRRQTPGCCRVLALGPRNRHLPLVPGNTGQVISRSCSQCCRTSLASTDGVSRRFGTRCAFHGLWTQRAEQVDRILASDTALRASRKCSGDLLRFLADKTFCGEAEHLKEYSVGLDALGKPATYDPRQDSGVRLQASRLRQKLDDYYRTEGSNDPPDSRTAPRRVLKSSGHPRGGRDHFWLHTLYVPLLARWSIPGPDCPPGGLTQLEKMARRCNRSGCCGRAGPGVHQHMVWSSEEHTVTLRRRYCWYFEIDAGTGCSP